MTWTLVLTHFACVILGIVVGRTSVWAALNMTRPPRRSHYKEPLVPTSTDHKRRRTVLLVAALLAFSAMFGVGVKVGYELVRSDIACINEYANKNADATEPRQQAVERRDRANDAVFEALGDFAIGQIEVDKVIEVLDEREAAVAALEAERKIRPYPEAPREVC